ncbi:MAG: peptidylprolyl isomerase [Cyanobacteria bacterium P01_A01_bin.105]
MADILQIGSAQLGLADVLGKLEQHDLLPRLVQGVVIDEALAAVECNAEEARQQYYAERQLLTPEQQRAWQQQQGVTPEQVAQVALKEVKLSRFKENTWGAQVESHFLQRKTQLDRVLYSLIRTKDASLAQELYFRLKDDEASFADLAKDYSEGQEAQTGGLIGPVELHVPHPSLGRLLSVSQPGQLWAPTPIGEWYVIARLEKFLPIQFDSATRSRMLDELFKSWLQQKMQQTEVQLTNNNATNAELESMPVA